MFKKIAFFALFLAVTGLFAATSVDAQRLVKGSLVKSTTTTDTLIQVEPEANPAFEPAQCANGGIGDPVQSCGTSGSNNWETGNMNGSKAHYEEGTSIHYRYVFTNLVPDGTVYTIRLAYDAFKAPTQHAIDYLNTYDADIDPGASYQVIPCGGVTGCAADTPDTIAIPDDPHLQNYVTVAGTQGIEPPSDLDGKRLDAVFTGWNLTFISATFLDYDPANAERVIEIKFTADAATAVLAWSGHVALGTEWAAFIPGHGGAGTISGSPYHMRNGGNGSFGDGQRELQLAASAVVAVPSAADATITGRVVDYYGRAISSARLTLTGSSGEARYAYTNTFGYYRFENVESGDSYFLAVDHRRYQFATSSQFFSLQDSVDGVNFQASR